MRKTFLLLVLVLAAEAASACDICGCGAGGSYIGILPSFHRQVMGLRYRNNSLQSHVGAGGVNTYLTTLEHYHNMELWGGWRIGQKYRLMVSLPFIIGEKTNATTRLQKSGPGDIHVTGLFRLLDKTVSVPHGRILTQTAWIGGGFKLPTGQYRAADKDNTMQSANLFQLGTGSTDFHFAGLYDLRLQRAGLNLSANYKMNTTNKDGYNYGNKLSGSAQLYYNLPAKGKLHFSPNAGLLFESSKKDLDHHLLVDMSGGRLLLAGAGAEAGLGKFSAGFSWQSPVSQNLAGGMVKARSRVMMHISVSF